MFRYIFVCTFLSVFCHISSCTFLNAEEEFTSKNYFKNYTSPETIQRIVAYFPLNFQNIDRFTKEAIQQFQSRRKAFNELPLSEGNYQNIVLGWERLMKTFIWKQTVLIFLPLITSNKMILPKAGFDVLKIQQKLIEACLDRKAVKKVLQYAEKTLANPKAENLTPSEMYILDALLKSIVEGLPFYIPEKERAVKIREKIFPQELLPFTYSKGNLKSENTLRKTISLVNWNVCCFDENLSMIFGGVLPWEYRIDTIAEVLKISDPDIISLQEVFSKDAQEELYLRLKDNYAHFYFCIGPKIYGFNLLSMGMPSGLFVASKLPLVNPTYHPFNSLQTPKNRAYGFFSFEIADKGKSYVRIITTHLQPGTQHEDQKFRHAQVEAISLFIDDKLPTMLCGDLNIENHSKEYEKEIAPFFFNHYKGPWTCLELRDYWWKAKQNVHLFHNREISPEWIDYFLSAKNLGRKVAVKTKLLFVNNPHHPEESISDHQAVFSTIDFFPEEE